MRIQQWLLYTLVSMMVCRNKAICKGNNIGQSRNMTCSKGFVILTFQRYYMLCWLVTLISVSCQHGACVYVTDWGWLGNVLNLNKSIVAHHFNNRVTKSLA